jgi:hypothetical protein
MSGADPIEDDAYQPINTERSAYVNICLNEDGPSDEIRKKVFEPLFLVNPIISEVFGQFGHVQPVHPNPPEELQSLLFLGPVSLE